MKLRTLALIVLVVGSVPAATALTPSATDSTALTDSTVSAAQDANETTETASDAGSDGSSASDSDDSDEQSTDYTKLYVESDYDYPELKPGESTTFNVTVANREDAEVELDPHVYVPPVGENLLEKSWVSIEGDSTVAAGGETTFTVTVSVPKDAQMGHYSGQIAFTNETVTYPGRPARPVHAAGISVEVWKKPTVEIVSNTYLRGQVEAGDTATKQIVIENNGDETVPLSPQYKTERDRYHGSSSSKIDPSWVDIDAPSSIGAGETATVTVTFSPPEDAESNRYRGELDLGLKDPHRDDDNNYWQRVSMNFDVWNQPDEPFETSFDVSEDAQNITLTLSPRSGYGTSSDSEPASFDVTFVKPDGTAVDAERVRVSDSGYVDLSESNDPNAQQQGEYSFRSGGQQFVYRIDDPEAGSWDLRVMPENVIGFSYEITRNETAE
ncbi:COG1470 family protein [Halorussus sp. AFM4]|uniref:COG1470 family protein n=1 Tax=Halorussus sp. AFM4 TaxID=3421651 RepID=UPI003EB79B90